MLPPRFDDDSVVLFLPVQETILILMCIPYAVLVGPNVIRDN